MSYQLSEADEEAARAAARNTTMALVSAGTGAVLAGAGVLHAIKGFLPATHVRGAFEVLLRVCSFVGGSKRRLLISFAL